MALALSLFHKRPPNGDGRKPATMFALVACVPLVALALVLVLPDHMLPDYRRGGWGRFAKRR